ncbi:hypothetical protein KC19_9G039100 [Ceratodon purpureus]|uniref:Uncharacterized protein n=1 Tax=Ceratodon purpureus TaxID=3225 RepID=A0A8T0GNH7_CERPU|nr:hypothetical protein KC19_9G039100 [Ceratodon purpureus]
MKEELHTSLSPQPKLDVVYRVGFIVVLMFAGYRMALACSRNVFLQDYVASIQPGLVVAAPYDSTPHAPAEKTKTKEKINTWPLLYPTFPNEGVSLLQQLHENSTLPCSQRRTFTAEVFGLPRPKNGEPIRLHTGKIHELSIVSYEENGKRRCAGGDYFETDLSGINWKTRPPILDNLDGSYGVQLMVDSRFAGLFVFKVVLLFANFHALDTWNCTAWSRFENVVTVEIEFVAPEHEKLPALRRCTDEDFSLKAWSGRWNRHTWNDTCEIRDDGRFVCIDPNEECQEPWCDGKVGALESNGWVYSAHCKFKIFTKDEAWDCLNKRWLFFWGDSNHEDTVRNLLNFVLGFPLEDVNYFRRWFNGTVHHPDNPQYSLTITKIFNGHYEEAGNLIGLSSLRNDSYRALLTSYFNGTRTPDTMVMNSGLHDAHFYKHASEFAHDGVDFAISFWQSLWTQSPPSIIYRTTVAGAGFAKDGSHARDGVPNPHKMEIFNRIFVEKLQQTLPGLKIVDAFDMTFPFHYDLNHTDGVHYGRGPSKTPWPWHHIHGFSKATQVGHQYFVDLMLVHILLNAICPLQI